MPEVVVYILEGRTLEQKRGLVKDITAAVVKNAGTHAGARHRLAGRDGEDLKSQRRRPVQRDAGRAGATHDSLGKQAHRRRRPDRPPPRVVYPLNLCECTAQYACCNAVNH